MLAHAVGHAVDEPADGLDATGHEDVALADLDRVGRHPDRLQRRRAVAVHRHARHARNPREQRGHAGDVVAGLAGGLTTPPQHVLDLLGVERGDLFEHRADDRAGQVVWTALHQRSLVGAPDRRAGSGDDDRLGHDRASLGSVTMAVQTR